MNTHTKTNVTFRKNFNAHMKQIWLNLSLLNKFLALLNPLNKYSTFHLKKSLYKLITFVDGIVLVDSVSLLLSLGLFGDREQDDREEEEE